MLIRTGVCLAASVALAYAAGGKPGIPTVNAPNSAEVRIFSEVVPAGGTAQIKVALTNPQPIMSGGTKFTGFDSDMQLNGVSLWGPSGDEAGTAVLRNGVLEIQALSASADLGTTEYPFLTVTFGVPSLAKAGTAWPLTMDPSISLLTSAGQLATTIKPGTLTVGGTFSIHGMTPGGGTYPAGTTIRIDGNGFETGLQLRTPTMKVSSFKVVSSTEIEFTLKSETTLDGQQIQITSPGRLVESYYSYLRGIPVRDPSTSILKNTDAMFQRQTHALAQIASIDAAQPGQYLALALQNPNPGPAVATLTLTHADGSSSSNSILLTSGARIMDTVAGLLNAGSTTAGDRLDLVSTSSIQILGLKVDELAGTVTPFLPAF